MELSSLSPMQNEASALQVLTDEEQAENAVETYGTIGSPVVQTLLLGGGATFERICVLTLLISGVQGGTQLTVLKSLLKARIDEGVADPRGVAGTVGCCVAV